MRGREFLGVIGGAAAAHSMRSLRAVHLVPSFQTVPKIDIIGNGRCGRNLGFAACEASHGGISR
jgi:hypothetical protein